MSDLLISPLSPDSLDIDSIKEIIKQDLIDNNVISDINYEGSNIYILVQIMAYMVYNVNATHALSANQTMLLLSEVRQNIIYLSQQLGYNITRPISSKMSITLSVDGLASGDTIVIPAGTKFKCGDYNFISQENITLSETSLEDVTSIIEGTLVNYETDEDLRFSPSSNSTNFLVNYTNIENDNLFVRVKKSSEVDYSDLYTPVDNLLDLKENTFFAEIEPETRYVNIYTSFIGNGYILTPSDSVDLVLLLSSGTKANGIVDCAFEESDTFTTSLNNSVTVNIDINGASSGGADEESSDSIKRNSPLFYNTGNRTVNPDDYKAFLIKNSLIEYATAWGGESTIPVNLGHAYLSFIPQDENFKFLTNLEQVSILQYLANPHIMAFGLILVPASYISIDYGVNILGDVVLIDNKKVDIENILNAYFNTNLIGFDKRYFENKVVREVESLFDSNSKASVKVINDFYLNLYEEQYYNFTTEAEVKYYIPNSSKRYYLVKGSDRIDVPENNQDLYSYYLNGWTKELEPDISYNITFSGTINGLSISEGPEEPVVIDDVTYTKKNILLDTEVIGYFVIDLDELIITTDLIPYLTGSADRIKINYDNEINVVCMKNQTLEIGNIIFS